MTFKPGQSGNPKGSAKGRKDWRTALRGKLEAAAPAIIDDLIARATEDLRIALFIANKVLPDATHKASPITTPLGLKGTPAEQADQVTGALAGGKISLDESHALMTALGGAAAIRTNSELTQRLESLERTLAELTGTTNAK